MLFRIVLLQLITTILLSLIVWIVKDSKSAYFVVLGGGSYLVPTAFAVLFLKILEHYSILASARVLIAEFLKIVLAVIALLVVFVYYPKLQFLPFLLGFLGASHFVFLIFLKVYRYGK